MNAENGFPPLWDIAWALGWPRLHTDMVGGSSAAEKHATRLVTLQSQAPRPGNVCFCAHIKACTRAQINVLEMRGLGQQTGPFVPPSRPGPGPRQAPSPSVGPVIYRGRRKWVFEELGPSLGKPPGQETHPEAEGVCRPSGTKAC